MKKIILICSIFVINSINCAADKKQYNNKDNYDHSQSRNIFNYVEGYPKEWQNIDARNFFGLLNDFKYEKDKTKFFCQFLNRAQAYFETESGKIFFSRCIYDLIKLNRVDIVSNWFKSYLAKNPSWIKEWFKYSKDIMPNFDTQNFSNCISALVKLGINIDKQWLEDWYKYSQEKMPLFKTQELSNSITALSKLNFDIDTRWMTCWYKYSYIKMREFNPQEFSNCIYALYKMNIIDNKWLENWYKYSQAKLADFDSQNFSNVIFALGRLRVDIDNMWLADWYKYSQEKLADFEQQALINSINGLALLNRNVDQQWLERWYEYSQNQICKNEFDSQDFGNVIYSLYRLKAKIDNQWLLEWFKYSKKEIRNFGVPELGKSINALAHFNIDMNMAWLDEWMKCCLDKIKIFENQDFIDSIHALSMFDIFIENQFLSNWVKKWLEYSQDRLQKFNAASLTKCIYALAKLKIDIDKKWLEKWYKYSIEKMPDYGPIDFASSISALAQLSAYIDAQWLQDWFKYSEERIDLFKPQDLSISLHSLALLSILPNKFFLLKIKNLPVLNNVKVLGVKALHQLFLFNQFYYMKTGNSWIEIDPINVISESNRNDTSIEIQVEGALKNIFKDYDIFAQEFFDEIGSYIDFYISSLNLVIQVDGPKHFLRNGNLDSSSVLLSKLLEFYGYKVLRLSYKDLNKLKYRSESVCFLKTRIGKI